MNQKPIVALTMGDPAGIGPEICLKAAQHPDVRAVCRPVIFGDMAVLNDARGYTHFEGELRSMDANMPPPAQDRDGQHVVVDVVDCANLAKPIPLGVTSAEGGTASFAYIQSAIKAAREGRVQAVATAPINKYSLKLAHIPHIGHTEIFAEATASPRHAMMMYSERLTVGLVTCHQSLATVPRDLTKARIIEVGELLHESLLRIRSTAPRIAVLGLNPHAGEHGMLGSEEVAIVEPAVKELKERGINVQGPFPPDTAFTSRMLSNHDAHLCLYHDQGLIPFKMISFEDGVNVTMGLPFPRTSVDHGTAYDIAGQGVAEVGSMIAAVRLAAMLAGGE